MSKQLFCLSAIGKDKTGIVSSISKVLFELGCNIENSTMTLLSGQFAMILLVAFPKSADKSKIKTKLKSTLKNIGLSYSVNEVFESGKNPKNFGDCVISVYGADKPGIVYNITKYLSDNNVNITDVQTSVTGSKPKNYIMLLEVQLPESLNIDLIKSQMKMLSKQLSVDISVNQTDSAEI